MKKSLTTKIKKAGMKLSLSRKSRATLMYKKYKREISKARKEYKEGNVLTHEQVFT
jgi:hypothetical protein